MDKTIYQNEVCSLIENPQSLIYMKVGKHGDETFEEILNRKNQELEMAGKIYWGYGGSICHPFNQVQPFVRMHPPSINAVYLFMEVIDTNFFNEPIEAIEYSVNGKDWESIPEGVRVSASKYAFILGEITRVEYQLCLGKYQVAIGPNRGKNAIEYLKNRVDKACLIHCDNKMNKKENLRRIGFVAKLVEPYAVMLRV